MRTVKVVKHWCIKLKLIIGIIRHYGLYEVTEQAEEMRLIYSGDCHHKSDLTGVNWCIFINFVVLEVVLDFQFI